jgi:hypothetical protein
MYSETKRTRRFRSIHLQRSTKSALARQSIQPAASLFGGENAGSLEELMQVVLQDGHRLRIQRRVREQLGQVH